VSPDLDDMHSLCWPDPDDECILHFCLGATQVILRLMIKPAALCPGNCIVAVSLSWGGPSVFPHRYEAGKRQFEDAFGVKVIESRHAMSDAAWLAANPEARASDLMDAFADPSVQGIISTIGGDDSIRLLPFLDLEVIRCNPKVFLGYSDSTVTHFACAKAGLGSFYGPSIMAGFGENGGLFPYMESSVRRTLFSRDPAGVITPNKDGWTCERLDWAHPELQNQSRRLNLSSEWHWLQGRGLCRGKLIGGCLEVIDWLRGSPVWPDLSVWRESILFIEISEEAITPAALIRILRSIAATGALQAVRGILFGRPYGEVAAFAAYDAALLGVCRELGLESLPLITRMDFGHTDPMFVVPYGVEAELDCDRQQFRYMETAVSKPPLL
jgi:muramoyltetrapeptide carboxypeptidase LdcA involved in peptidoglycan recycling